MFATRRYDIVQYLCHVCCRFGENTVNKQYGAARFCSTECEAVYLAYEVSKKEKAA